MGKKNTKSGVIAQEALSGEAAEKIVSGEHKKKQAFLQRLAKLEVRTSIEEFTNSKLVHYHYFRHEFKELSKEPGDWYVTMFFPIAEVDGQRVPTYIDRPQTERQLALCEKKAEIMKKLGHRYIVYVPESEVQFREVMDEIATRDTTPTGDSFMRGEGPTF